MCFADFARAELFDHGLRESTELKLPVAGPSAFDVCEPGQVGNEAATAN
jgi:hypothetical protein